MSASVVVVGSGPAGFYCAEAIHKKAPGVSVDIVDRLPTPFGLVRSGVAPDHQGTKNVWRVFDRTARRDAIRFVGGVEVGKDVSVAELLGLYDAVVLAVGAPVDRALGIEGESLEGVYGSGAFTAWYNGHPDFSGLNPTLRGPGIAVVGHGNVAVDVVRVLGRTRSEMAKTDLPAYAMEAVEQADYRDIYMLGRRGAAEASFTPVELRELGDLAATDAMVKAEQLPETVTADDPKQQKLKEKILGTLRVYAENRGDTPRRLHLEFFASPTRILGDERVEGIELSRTAVRDGRAVPTGETFVLDVGTVITCIGFGVAPLAAVPQSKGGHCYENEAGKVSPRLYAVGWAKRGPSGVIATNRQDSASVAHRLVDELEAEAGREGGPGLDRLLQSRGSLCVDYAGWERIDQAEQAAASEEAPRQKLTDWASLRAAAEG